MSVRVGICAQHLTTKLPPPVSRFRFSFPSLSTFFYPAVFVSEPMETADHSLNEVFLPNTVEKPVSRRRYALWSLSALSTCLLVAVVSLAVAYVKLDKHCTDSCSSTSSPSATPTEKYALPGQFTIYGVEVTGLDGNSHKVDWSYDSTTGMDTVSWSSAYAVGASSSDTDIVHFVRNYENGIMEMRDEKGNCQGFPMTLSQLPRFSHVSEEASGTDTDQNGNVCQRQKARRSDGSVYYYSTRQDANGNAVTCSIEHNGNTYRFTADAAFSPLDSSRIQHVCPDAHVSNRRSHSNVPHLESFWGDVKCWACEHALSFAIDKLAAWGSDAVCAELGPFAVACGYIAEEAIDGICRYENCAKRGCDAIHLC